MLDVALFDLLHETFAVREVTEEIRGELPRDDEDLIVGDFGKRYGTTRGNQVCAPLEHEAGVPESADGDDHAGGCESGVAGAEVLSGAIEENSETENEKWSERNEKAIAVGRDAVPIGVTGD